MDNKENWLDQLLDELGWTPADLARATKLDSAVISNIRNGRRQIGIDTAIDIGRATNRKPETILRMAGRLPEIPVDEWADEMAHKLSLLSNNSRTYIEDTVETILKREEANRESTNSKPHKPAHQTRK